MRTKTILIAWIFTASTLFSTAADHPSAGGAEPGGINVPGFGAVEKTKAEKIGLSGPATAEVGQEVVVRLTGTPPVDLTEPLTGQLSWLMGDDRLFCYLVAEGAPLRSLDVRGELVFGTDGATIQPLLRIECTAPGEVRIICDWNFGQNQMVDHLIVVTGDSPRPDPKPDPKPEPDPEPDPNPIVPPLEHLDIILMIEKSDQRGTGGVALFEHIQGIKRYLRSLKVQWTTVDDDQSAWESYYTHLADYRIQKPPALMVADRRNNTVVTVIAFGENEQATIETLKEMGVK